MRFVWQEATEAIRERLDAITFRELINRSDSEGCPLKT